MKTISFPCCVAKMPNDLCSLQAVTGYGKADKKQVQQMVRLLLKMDEVPRPDDAADAIACAITHCQAGVAKKQFLMK